MSLRRRVRICLRADVSAKRGGLVIGSCESALVYYN